MSDQTADDAIGRAPRSTYAGLFLVTLATLAYQILLTRIFSVTIWYHFAFLAISVAMLGMTIGAIAVYLFPETFRVERVHRQLALSSLVFSLTIVLSVLVHLAFPVRTDGSASSILMLVVTCVLIAIPFTASGICVALALTRFPPQVSSLYGVDLAGASVGCVAVIGLLWVTDGPTAVFAVALIASIAAICFARAGETSIGLRRAAVLTGAMLALFVIGHTILVHQQQAWVRIKWAVTPRGPMPEAEPLHESWNTHSRVRVSGDPDKGVRPFGWGMSPTMPRTHRAKQLRLVIDSGAMTVLTGFDGDLSEHEYLRYDVTNLVHYLRRDADVLVVGAGGGRDLLSTLVFDQASVTGLEINADILGIVNGVFGDFTGRLDQRSDVSFVNDEARSWIARSRDRFDVIQISLIDSFAATAAGAFVLSEHGLYTVEAWKIFLSHLKPDGVLTVTRFYFPDQPATAYRLVSVAVEALAEMGVENPRDHIALVRTPGRFPMVTALVGRDPLSPSDYATIDSVSEEMKFSPVLTSDHAADETFRRIAEREDLDRLYAEFPLDITPSTDNRPFFFHMLRFRDVFDWDLHADQGEASFNITAVTVLGALLATVTGLTVVFVVAPLVLRSRLARVGELTPWLLVFMGIGGGFMMVEISQMERLIVFLGHPIYALSVVLFTLLLSSGLGSFTTDRIEEANLAPSIAWRLGLLLAALAVFGLLTPYVIEELQTASTTLRILASVALLAPIGFLMGMPFAMGMKAASLDQRSRELTPWLWGMNGAISVLASVLAIVVAMEFGITASFWTGFGFYVLAAASLMWGIRVRLA